jgi:hypothetical protein
MGIMRTPRIKLHGRRACYHCISRVVDRHFRLGPPEKEQFRRIMRLCEYFCGVRILTYALMGNHYHILVEVVPIDDMPDDDLVELIRYVYGDERAVILENTLTDCRRREDAKGLQAAKQAYIYRMGDISEFMKMLLQRFTQWYNRKYDRSGTLWEERFRSVLVQDDRRALVTIAAYIDLNAIRAGLAEKPQDYRWCGYAEAVAGFPHAQEGLGIILGNDRRRCVPWKETQQRYHKHLYLSGRQRSGPDGRQGFDPEEVQQVMDKDGRLSMKQLMQCRVRYFTDGGVMGTRAFVNEIFEGQRRFYSHRRREGARPMKHGEWGDLYTMRDLRNKVVFV